MTSLNLAETEAGLGCRDNALAELRSRHLEKLIDEPEWHSNEPADFHARAVVTQYQFTDAERVSAASDKPPSGTSSMAVSIHTQRSTVGGSLSSSYAASSRTPSLGPYSSAKSGSSVRTSRADSFLRPTGLEEDESGTPQVPTAQNGEGRLACCFSFLSCPYRSNSLDEWDMHCQSHFRGILPKEVHCPFECNWTRSEASGSEAWRRRILHIVAEHPDEEIDTASRPKASLIDHLWRHRIIDAVQKKELVRHGRLTGDISVSSSGPLQHNRAHRRQIRAGA